MKLKDIFTRKFNIALIIVALMTLVLELTVFNYSALRSLGLTPISLSGEGYTDENGDFYSGPCEVDCQVKNVYADIYVEDYETAEVSVILTDEGDKYEYVAGEFTVCNGVEPTHYSNVYPQGEVHTIELRVMAEEGTHVVINSLWANESKPIDVKPIRMLVVFVLLLGAYLTFSRSFIHEYYYDPKNRVQNVITLLALIMLILIGRGLSKSDLILQDSPWPHHKQYQELAHSLKEGSVILSDHEVDEGLLNADNPYDTIALMSDGVTYSMDYAYYEGHYYEYFGIVPEVLFYYPYYCLTGRDLSNATVIFILYALLAVGLFGLSGAYCSRYLKSLPYFGWLGVTFALALMADFVYLVSRPDIYNIPILAGSAFAVIGLALYRFALNMDASKGRKGYAGRLLLIAGGSLSMALVAGCRPQLFLIFGLVLIWFFFEDGIKSRRLLTKETLWDTVCFVLPYVAVAALVCWYNYARFGNIFDFGATYSLTTNDMNHRGFNLERIFRGLYSFLLEPTQVSADFPFVRPTELSCDYLGRYMVEYTYGGLLTANAFMFSILMLIGCGFKKMERPLRGMLIYLLVCGLVIAGFDANGAGVLLRYSCDCALPLSLAAGMLWMVYLDRGRNVIRYDISVRIAYVAFALGLFYSLMVFCASGSSISLINDNKALYYTLASYFRF